MGKEKKNQKKAAADLAAKIAKIDIKIADFQSEIDALNAKKKALQAEYNRTVKPAKPQPPRGNAGSTKK